MPNFLVLYASTHGHTAKIAERIADILRGHSATVTVEQPGADTVPTDFDAVVVGGSIHNGHHQRELVDWARRHHANLGLLPAAFFTVCLTAADDTEESRVATRRYLDEFVESTDWTPKSAVTFAGALQYREYDFLTRLVMRLLMHKRHHPTDIGRDFDYTDWDQVERFARECSAMPSASA